MAWPPISRDDLKSAATTAGFDTVFPLLIRRLIAETADGLISIDMPGGSGTASGGFDGVVTTTGMTAFVPAGTSVWELSVGGGQSKAEDDYSKRLAAPDGLPTTDVAYVEALLVPWTKARTWQTEKLKDGRWRDVRGYNLDRIHAWLDQAPATMVWLAEHLGKAMPGVESLGQWWQDAWIQSTTIPLTQTIVLAGREEAASSLLSFFRSGQTLITLGGDLRGDEASAFVAATLAREGLLDGTQTGARAVLVKDETSLKQLVAQPNPMAIVLEDLGLARGVASTQIHKLIARSSSGSPDIDVPRLDSQVVASQFETAGRDSDEARRLGALGRQSLLALRRTLAHHPDVLTPAWVEPSDPVLRRMLLVGTWAPGNASDQTAVADCIDESYREIESRASHLAASPDMPFTSRVGDIWHVVALEDAWSLIAKSLTLDDMERFAKTALEVLSEPDPILELAPEERWRLGMTGTRRRYSTNLRLGLARSLALLGSRGNPVLGTSSSTSDSFATSVVRQLLDAANSDATYRSWASLVDVLGLLAEASPQDFLEAMQEGLAGSPPLHLQMFTDDEQSDRGLGSSSIHSNFLWALERLAWSPDLADDVVDVLASLSAIDPGGRVSNRPFASLVGILSAWSPNTSATVEDRIRGIRRVVQYSPAIGRKLLLALIPDGHGIQMVHPGPAFRDWKLRPSSTLDDLRAVVEVVVQLLLETTSDEPEDYLDLVEKLDHVSGEHRVAMVAALQEWGNARPDDDGRQSVYDRMREKVAHHREYRDAAWALPEAELATMQKACEALVSSSPSRRHAWMFRADWITLGDFQRRDQFEAYEKELVRRRAIAIGEVLDELGVGGLSGYADRVENPFLVGSALADHSPHYVQFALDHLNVGDQTCSALSTGYLNRRLGLSGPEERDRLLSMSDDPVVQARILRFSGDPLGAWSKLEELAPAVTEAYWREFSYYGLGADFQGATDAAWALLDADRPAAAIQLLLLYRRSGLSAQEADLVATALERLMATGMSDPEARGLDHYDLERLFRLLAEHRDHLGNQRVVILEWQMLPIVGLPADAPSLHRAIADEPGFFVELIGHAFRPATDSSDEEVADENRRNVASRAYEVLRSSRRCPGADDAGQIDEGRLSAWVEEARALLADTDRVVIGDLQIGELLAHSPHAADGAPLAESVRDLLERVRSRDIERGIGVAILNMRGVTSRGLADGGSRESALANAFHEHAKTARSWPRTRKIFREIAESYEADARREDARAERFRQGLD